VKRAGAVAVLAACACSSSPVPSHAELAAAIASFEQRAVAPEDVAHIACIAIEEEPGEFICRWRQVEGRFWQDMQSILAIDAGHWILVDTPGPRP
jgi:hypothetical protein